MSNPVIHRSKLFGGEDVRKVYAETVFRGKRCTSCRSDKVALRIQTFIGIDEMPNRADREATKLLVKAGEFKGVPFDDGTVGIRVGEAFACASCAPAAERAAARAPSHARVTFDRLPSADRALVAVSSKLILP